MIESSGETLAYLHLLWDHELAALRRLFEDIAKNCDRLLARWHQLYVQYCGSARCLVEGKFRRIFGRELNETIEAVLASDLAHFTSALRISGDALRTLKTPFSELIVSAHLFLEAAVEAFPKTMLEPATYRALDKLQHCRIILLGDAYFRAHIPSAPLAVLCADGSEKNGGENRTSFGGIVGGSPAIVRLYSKIEAAARTRGTVLIVGESGTGKELVAHALHECGPNPDAPFVPLNCSALPKDLTESELFGYRRGAFSGAREGYLGLFRAADGGTLFLDDITEMSMELQAKLLRAIQERSVRPVGFTVEIPVDVRIIASTNQDPAEALRGGKLREDLYYRLQANVFRVPSVRERAGDIAPLAIHFLEFFNSKMIRRMTNISKDAMTAMNSYSWPGNVREIANTIESAFTFGRGPAIELCDLPVVMRSMTGAGEPSIETRFRTYADVERDLFARALATTAGNRSEAAQLLQVSRKKLYDKIAKYHLG